MVRTREGQADSKRLMHRVSRGEESEHTAQGGVSLQQGTHVTWGNHRRDVVGDGEK